MDTSFFRNSEVLFISKNDRMTDFLFIAGEISKFCFLECFVNCRVSIVRLIAFLFISVGLCVITGLLLCVLYKSKNQREREYKRIQMKMDELEFSVRNECKQVSRIFWKTL